MSRSRLIGGMAIAAALLIGCWLAWPGALAGPSGRGGPAPHERTAGGPDTGQAERSSGAGEVPEISFPAQSTPVMTSQPGAGSPPAMAPERLRAQEAPRLSESDKGSTYTDMGAERPMGTARPALTDRERALLDLARVAIEASRAAGTLQMSAQPEIQRPQEPDAESAKRDLLSHPEPADPPTSVTGSPRDHRVERGAGHAAARGKVNAVPMTAEEARKLAEEGKR